MRLTRAFVASSTLALAACVDEPRTVSRGEYCATAARVELRDLCEPGEAPKLVGAWGSCSITTRTDAEALAAEAKKHDTKCTGREVKQ